MTALAPWLPADDATRRPVLVTLAAAMHQAGAEIGLQVWTEATQLLAQGPSALAQAPAGPAVALLARLSASDRLLDLALKAAAGPGQQPDPAQSLKLRTAIQAMAWLHQREPPAGPGPTRLDPAALVNRARRMVAAHSQQSLRDAVPEELLAARALLHALGETAGPHGLSGTSPPLAAAFQAWRQGFREAGPRSAFAATLHRMHKATTWIRRASPPAVQADASTAAPNPLKAGGQRLSHGLKAVAGRRLSPFSAMGLGIMGADHGHLRHERAQALSHASEAIRHLEQALSQAAPPPGSPQHLEQLARLLWLRRWANLEGGPVKNAPVPRPSWPSFLATLPANCPLPGLQVRRSVERILNAPHQLRTLERWAASLPEAESAARDAVRMQVAMSREVRRGSAVPLPADTADDLRRTAHRCLETEGVRFQHGGTHGLGVVAGLGLAPGLPGPSIVGGPALRGTHARSAIVAIGTSTLGSELFIGTEQKLQGSLTGAVSVGLHNGPLAEGSWVAGAWAGGRLTAERSHERGVSLRISKTHPDHRAIGHEVVNFFFDAAAKPPEATNPDTLWDSFCDRFGDQPVSVVAVDTQGRGQGASVGVAGGVRLGIPDFSAGPYVGASLETTWTHQKRHELSGLAPTMAESVNRRNVAVLRANLLAATGGAVPIGGQEAVSSLRLIPPMRLGDGSTAFNLPGSRGAQVRLTLQNGRVEPSMTLMQRDFKQQSEFIAWVSARSDLWRQATEPAGAPEGSTDALNRFIAELDLMPQQLTAAQGHCTYTERLRLRPAAADRLSWLMACQQVAEDGKAEAHPGMPTPDEQMHTLLRDDSSWEPEKLAVSEAARTTRAVGLDFGLVLSEQHQAQSTQRYLAELKARPAAAELADAEDWFDAEDLDHDEAEDWFDATEGPLDDLQPEA